ncbi:MAG: hypothetical protein JWR85_4177 [Marmoricola sp.]|nr:hypothetical protein [Marmoricola sp.]
MQSGQPLPDRIANAPELEIGLSLYLDAFFDLDSERSHAAGITAIPYSQIRDYANAYDFDAEQTSDLMFFIRNMDTDHMKRLGEKMKALANKTKG